MSYPKNMNDYQFEVALWAKYNFPDETKQTVCLGIAEESGELCRAVLKQCQGIRGTSEQWEKEIRKEMGDILIKLFHAAEILGDSLHAVFKERWETVKVRDFRKDSIGHGMPEE